MKDDSVSDELTGTLRTGLLFEPCFFSRASRMTGFLEHRGPQRPCGLRV